MKRIGFALNPTSGDALQLRDHGLAWCEANGVDAWAAPSDEALLQMQLRDPPPRLPEAVGQSRLFPVLRKTVARLLAKDSARRPSTTELWRMLRVIEKIHPSAGSDTSKTSDLPCPRGWDRNWLTRGSTLRVRRAKAGGWDGNIPGGCPCSAWRGIRTLATGCTPHAMTTESAERSSLYGAHPAT